MREMKRGEQKKNGRKTLFGAIVQTDDAVMATHEQEKVTVS